MTAAFSKSFGGHVYRSLFRRPKPYQGQYRLDKRAIELPAGTNMELFSATFGLMGRLTVENGFDSEKNYMGSMLVTHPDYQCQGHAIRLVRHALKFADDTNKKWYAGCWPASASMYKKLGFVYQTMETLDFNEYRATGTAIFTLLIKEPKLIDSTTGQETS